MKKNILSRLFSTDSSAASLAAAASAAQPAARRQRREAISPRIIRQSVSRTRRDIADWQSALRQADNVDYPRRTRLVRLYDDILLDAHLHAQIDLRFQRAISAPLVVYRGDKIDQGLTDSLASMSAIAQLQRLILDAQLYGHTLLELSTHPDGSLAVELIPRTHVIPERGVVVLRESDTTGIDYREAREYGSWLLEFGDSHDYGLLNKAVPHVLFKKFAQSCWSELCEIYGIPPRYIQTDTTDPAMLSRAESMMRELGSAAWFIIDKEEAFNFAKGADTNGDVYRNLITLCNNELSLLISGAVVGQDTVNGNRSKEEVGITLMDKKVLADQRYLERAWNDTVVPALVRIGVLPQGCSVAIRPEEDTDHLLQMCIQLLPYKDIDDAFFIEKFGIPVIGSKGSQASLSAPQDDGFFD